jgi:hypothetical protein
MTVDLSSSCRVVSSCHCFRSFSGGHRKVTYKKGSPFPMQLWVWSAPVWLDNSCTVHDSSDIGHRGRYPLPAPTPAELLPAHDFGWDPCSSPDKRRQIEIQLPRSFRSSGYGTEKNPNRHLSFSMFKVLGGVVQASAVTGMLLPVYSSQQLW